MNESPCVGGNPYRITKLVNSFINGNEYLDNGEDMIKNR